MIDKVQEELAGFAFQYKPLNFRHLALITDDATMSVNSSVNFGRCDFFLAALNKTFLRGTGPGSTIDTDLFPKRASEVRASRGVRGMCPREIVLDFNSPKSLFLSLAPSLSLLTRCPREVWERHSSR